MSDKEATRFINDLQNDLDFLTEMSKVKGDPKMAFDTVISRGYDVTPEEITEAYLEFSSSSLSEQDLKDVSAGLTRAQENGVIAGVAVAGALGAGVAAGVTTAIVLTAVGSSAAAACI